MEMNTNTNSTARSRKQRSGPARFLIGLFKFRQQSVVFIKFNLNGHLDPRILV